MLKKFLCLICVMVSLCSLLTACSSEPAEETADITPLVGSWYHSEAEYDATYNLYFDNTYSKHMVSKGEYTIPMDSDGTFECVGNKIIFDGFAEYEYELSGNKMIWTTSGGSKIEYTKN